MGVDCSQSLPPADLSGIAWKVTSVLALLFGAEGYVTSTFYLQTWLSRSEKSLCKPYRNIAAAVSASYNLVSCSSKKKNVLRKTCDHQANKKSTFIWNQIHSFYPHIK